MKVEVRKIILFLSIECLLCLVTSALSSPSVIIVGAGMSGISAAKKLHDNNIKDFIILEATNRIAGRIHKTNFGGCTVEMGANWLHGKGGNKKNPMYEIAMQMNLRNFYSDFSNSSFNTYKQDGGRYAPEEVDAAFDMAESNEEFGTKLSAELRANKNYDDDMSILAAERLNRMEPKTPLERMADFYTFDFEQAEAPRVTSVKHVLPFSEFDVYGDGEYFVADPRGFEGIVHTIAKSFLEYNNETVSDSRVKFNQVVTEVEYKSSGVTVKTEDGKEYKAKYVILSPSIGVLQSDLIKFKPELPMWKRRAIAEFSLAVYTKIFLKFPKRFWPVGEGLEFFFYVHARRGYYSMWQQLETEYPGSNVLMVTVTDDESRRVEQQSEEATKTEIMEILRKIFGDHIPDPIDMLIPRWYSDRFYRGTFSNWPVGYTQKKHDDLRAPVGRVHFTGEHTHPELFGYADGAYFAGENTAMDVIHSIKGGIIWDAKPVDLKQI